MQRAFEDGYVTETGDGIVNILPARNIFSKESTEKRLSVLDKLKAYLRKFLNTSEGVSDIEPVQYKVIPYRNEEEEEIQQAADAPSESVHYNGNNKNIKTMETPTKENTLYLTIKQVYFDQIMAGTKKEEYRDISPNTFKKYLACDKQGIPYVNMENYNENDFEFYGPLEEFLMACKDGKFPFYFREDIKFLNLAVGYNKVRDTAIVEVTDITPMITKNNKGQEVRFNVNNEGRPVMDPTVPIVIGKPSSILARLSRKTSYRNKSKCREDFCRCIAIWYSYYLSLRHHRVRVEP